MSNDDEQDNEKLDLRLILFPEPLLRYPAVPFTEDQIKSDLVANIIESMSELMYEYSGIGIAAQQVGIPNSIFIMDTKWFSSAPQADDKKRNSRIFINPSIIELDGDVISLEQGEGCLSLPYGYKAPVKRASRVHLQWLDTDAKAQDEWFEDVEAICVQHEMDHLEGILFVDRLSKLRQDMFMRRYNKVMRKCLKSQKKVLKQLRSNARRDAR